MDAHLEYLSLLEELAASLDRLTGLANQKTQAVRRNDLMGLDEVIKQEQALALSLRGYEQKRLKLLTQLDLQTVPLVELPQAYPASLQSQAAQAVNSLRHQYKLYRTAAELATNTLEVNLHQIEQFIATQGGAPAHGPGYTPPAAEPPKNMKTDFRA